MLTNLSTTIRKVSQKQRNSSVFPLRILKDSKTPDDILCPCCFELPNQEIFQCDEGHPVCHRCFRNLKTCPQCKKPFEVQDADVRCLILEDILNKINFQCYYKELGCTEKGSRKEIAVHVESCKYKPDIQLCHLIGLKCRYPVETSNLAGALGHFSSSHEVLYCNTTGAKITLGDFTTAAGNGNTVWLPVIIELINNGPKFLFFCKVNKEDKSFSVNCISLGAEDATMRKEFRIQFHIHANKKENDVIWTSLPIDIETASGINLNPIRIPLGLLKQHFVNNASLSVTVNVLIPQTFQKLLGRNRIYDEISVFTVSKIPGKEVHGAFPDGWIERYQIQYTCGGCRLEYNFIEIFYQCVQCSERYYLCDGCKQRGVHSYHIFAVLDTLSSYKFMREFERGVEVESSLDEFLQTVGASTDYDRFLRFHTPRFVSVDPQQANISLGRIGPNSLGLIDLASESVGVRVPPTIYPPTIRPPFILPSTLRSPIIRPTASSE